MRLACDLHIHTALSPCGDRDMTPNNIVNMAIMNELDVIAITDHHATGNIKAVMDVAKSTNLLVIPGMEVETREEIHVVCLFTDLNAVYNMQNYVDEHLPKRVNPEKIFGEQLLFDANDEVIGRENKLLSFSTDLSIEQVLEKSCEFGGVGIPAHIDRPSYSLISNLGMIPEGLKIKSLEVSRYAQLNSYQNRYPTYRVIQSSDAHDLGYIGTCGYTFEVEERSIGAIIHILRMG